MRFAYVAVLLLLPIAGCASRTAEPVSQPKSAEQPSGTTPTAGSPTPSAATPKTSAATPKPSASKPNAAAPPPKPAAPSAAAPPPSAAPTTLDLAALKEQLKATKAIGVFTKISLKNQVDDLMGKFRDYYQGKAKVTMPELRRSYDLLMMKVLSLLQDSDQKLASEVVSSREAIWALLSDPKKFATLDA